MKSKHSVKTMACVLAAGTLLAAGVGSAQADAVIDVGDHVLQPNTPNQSVDITVTGASGLKDFDLFADLGDGGPEIADYGLPAGAAGPHIMSATPVGTVWDAHNYSEATAPSLPQFLIYSISLTDFGDSISGDGTLIHLQLDTTGYTSGTWTLKLGSTATGDSSDFGALGVPQIVNGSVSIAAVPEPASLALLGISALALLRRR